MTIVAACQQPVAAGERAVLAPAAKLAASESRGLKTAIFAGGCFWGVEGVFSHVKGVTSAVSGYHGGTSGSARYRQVSAGSTRHAEAVRVTYDPTKVGYDELLRIFFSVITDPTQLNRQGPDRGAHYRSALVPIGAEQHKVAKAYLKQLAGTGLWKRPIVTRIETRGNFYRAEKYHQDFMLANPSHPYILRWDAPKVAALKKLYPGRYKARFTTD
ncbi:MAG: peptide-methionine (S)-S-oxide reductase MsrA [Novosphingobium sp.]|nr:peptide-methionine (S)-S-oxide reductase MsrA [Novosphingobium sp.]